MEIFDINTSHGEPMSGRYPKADEPPEAGLPEPDVKDGTFKQHQNVHGIFNVQFVIFHHSDGSKSYCSIEKGSKDSTKYNNKEDYEKAFESYEKDIGVK